MLITRINAADKLLNGGRLIAARLIAAAQSKLHGGLSWRHAGASRNLHYTPGCNYRTATGRARLKHELNSRERASQTAIIESSSVPGQSAQRERLLSGFSHLHRNGCDSNHRPCRPLHSFSGWLLPWHAREDQFLTKCR